jgi:A/G-specific adenine glycosylase
MSEALSTWFLDSKRSLPWRVDRTPYRVWLSEVMLQQTQVARVVDYFERFVARFPTVQDLAAADLDEVLSLWSGLGYYSRGRNLHRAAQAVVADFGGVFPSSSAALRTLPGVGAYTAAAVASFAGGERVAVVDGNVIRVISRVVDEGRDVAVAAADINATADAMLGAAADAAVHNEAMMELGALVCTPKAPRCGDCPIRPWCRALAAHTVLSRPVKKKAAPRARMRLAVVVVVVGDRFYVERRPGEGLFGGLWQPPTEVLAGDALVHDDHVDHVDHIDAWATLMSARGLPPPRTQEPIIVQRTLTHRELTFVVAITTTTTTTTSAPTPPPGTEGRLVSATELGALGVSSAVMAIFEATRSPLLF